MNRPYLIVILLCVASLAAGVGGTAALLASRKRTEDHSNAIASNKAIVENIPEAVVHGTAEPARLPSDRVLLPSADAAEVRGKPVSGHSEWRFGNEGKKDVLWDAEKRHLVSLLPNEKLAELQGKLTPK